MKTSGYSSAMPRVTGFQSKSTFARKRALQVRIAPTMNKEAIIRRVGASGLVQRHTGSHMDTVLPKGTNSSSARGHQYRGKHDQSQRYFLDVQRDIAIDIQ